MYKYLLVLTIVLCTYPFYDKGVLTPKQIRGIIVDDNTDDFWIVDFSLSLKGDFDNQEVLSVPSNDCLLVDI